MYIKMHVSVEKSIPSLQIDFNVPLKESKYKTSEQHFQNVPFFSGQLFLCHKSLMHWLAPVQQAQDLHKLYYNKVSI